MEQTLLLVALTQLSCSEDIRGYAFLGSNLKSSNIFLMSLSMGNTSSPAVDVQLEKISICNAIGLALVTFRAIGFAN